MTRRIFTTIFVFLLLITAKNLFPAPNSQALYEQGIEAFKSGNFGSSELLLRKIIDNGETEYRDKAWYHLALSIFYQKKYQSAIFEFNRFLSSCTIADLCSMARYWIAESYFQLNDTIRAIQEFNRFIAQSKNKDYIVQSYDRIGRIYFTQKRYDEAIIEWMKALGKSEDQARNNLKRLNIGEAYFLNENYDEAINFLLPILNSNTDTRTLSMARLLTGRAYQIKEKHAQALKIFSTIDETLLTEKPFNDVQYYRALSYIALGNYNFAILHLKTFLSTGKDSQWIYYAKFELGNIYLKENNTKDATQLLEEVRNGQTDAELKAKASLKLAGIYFDTNLEESIKCLKEATTLQNQDDKKEALLLLSKAYAKNKNFDEAESILKELINNYSFDKDIDLFHYLLATVYFEKGDMEKSRQSFDRIKEVNPFSKYINESYYYLALTNIKNKPEEAINLFSKYISLKKAEKKYEAYTHLLKLYAGKHDFNNSNKILNILIRYYSKEKDIENIFFKYAKILKENRKPSEYLYDIIIKRYNKSDAAGNIYLVLGDEAFLKKNYTQAEYYYRQYLSVHWRDKAASVFLYRIISLERLGKHKEVISIFESDDSIPPVDDFTSKQLALWKSKSYYNAGDCQKAYDSFSVWRLSDLSEEDLGLMTKCSIKVNDIATAEKATELIHDNKNRLAEAYYDLGLYYLSENNLEKAGDYFTRIIQETPSSNLTDSARAELADVSIKNDKYEEAIQILNQVKGEKIQLRKNELLVVSNFNTGNEKEAIEITKKYFKNFLKSVYGETVIKENLLYYYRIKNVKDFNLYARYLTRYPGNSIFLNYYYAKINFDTLNYKTSYYYFYKLSGIESEYKNEALFYLGLISLLNNNDVNSAQKYLSSVSGDDKTDNKFAMLGKIDLSILSSETGNIDLSKKVLFDILNNTESVLLRIQAENLIEYFGYKNMETGTN